MHHDFVPRGDTTFPALRGRPIAELMASEVATFRFPDASRIPTLVEVADLVGDRCTLYVELKARRIEKLVLDCLRDSGGRYALHSFDHAAIARARDLAPEVELGILSSSYLLDPVGALRAAGARDYWQSAELVDEELVERIHEAGGRVIVWTVNGPAEADALRAAGADGICSDDLRVVSATRRSVS